MHLKTTRLCLLLGKLNKRELRPLSELVSSPFFNRNKKCIELLDILLEFHEIKFEDEILTDEYVFGRLFPEKKKMTKTLNSTMSELVKLVEELKIQLELQEQQFIRQEFLLKSLSKSGERKYFDIVYPKVKKRLENINNKDSMYYLDKYLLSLIYYKYSMRNPNFNFAENATEVIHYLDEFYMGEKLRLASAISSINHKRPKDYELDLIEDIIKVSSKEKFQDNGLLQLFRQVFLMFSNQEEEQYFEDFMQMFWGKYTDSVKKTEVYELFKAAISYCVAKRKTKKIEYTEKMYQLHLFAFDHKLMFTGKYMHQTHLVNLINITLIVNKPDEAIELNEKYIDYVHPTYRNNAYYLNKASINFFNKKFDDAMTCLTKMEERNRDDAKTIRTLLLMCYYELNESNAFYSLCTSYRAYLRNKTEFPKIELGIENFIKILKKIYRVKEGFSNKSLEKIREEIQTTKPVHKPKWLIKKLEELN